jgi:hypothetical protein
VSDEWKTTKWWAGHDDDVAARIKEIIEYLKERGIY